MQGIKGVLESPSGTAAPQCGSLSERREKEPQWAAAVPRGKSGMSGAPGFFPESRDFNGMGVEGRFARNPWLPPGAERYA